MLLSAVSVLVVAQSSSEIPEGLMNNPVSSIWQDKILTLITFLYMFRALLCSSLGGQIVLVQHLVSSLSLGDCSVHRLREDWLDWVSCWSAWHSIQPVLLCSPSGGQIVLVQHLVSSLSLGDCSVHKLRKDWSFLNLCTEQSPKESDDIRCCTNTIWPPEDEHNNARNM